MDLVIVESPNKKSTIEQYLGHGWRVEASYGHIADLPLKSLGINLETFHAQYELTEKGKKRIEFLKSLAAKATQVWLATDPDREGEAIACHLAHFLKLNNPKRIVFHEITESAVKAAIQQPQSLNRALYDAQQARRMSDRLVGFLVSPILSQAAGKRLSAGRVQSPTVKLIVERERSIRQFQSTTHYGVKVVLNHQGIRWSADWVRDDFIVDKTNPYILERDLAQRVAGVKRLIIEKTHKKVLKKSPPPPFITTTLQRAASNQLGLTAAQTMEKAQILFEKSYITYHRTDNPNLSNSTWPVIQKVLERLGMGGFTEAKMRTFSSKANAQEAHEAIRPTDFQRETIESQDECLNKLYQMIRLRALASQMNAAKIQHTTMILKSLQPLENTEICLHFEARAKQTLALGWQSLTAVDQSQDNTQQPSMPDELPNLPSQTIVDVATAKVCEKQTQAPSRYSESALIALLEKKGIGRPSTYASILKNITDRGYVRLLNKCFHAEATGELVVDTLGSHFEFMDLDFTKGLEEKLDRVVTEQEKYGPIVGDIFKSLQANLNNISQTTGHSSIIYPCPDCQQGVLQKRLNQSQKPFWGCSNYQAKSCQYVEADIEGVPLSIARQAPDYPHCPRCRQPMIKRSGKQGDFWVCHDYQDCRLLLADLNGSPDMRFPCPKCGCPLKQNQGKRGVFWGCSGYHQGCKTAVDDCQGRPKIPANAA